MISVLLEFKYLERRFREKLEACLFHHILFLSSSKVKMILIGAFSAATLVSLTHSVWVLFRNFTEKTGTFDVTTGLLRIRKLIY